MSQSISDTTKPLQIWAVSDGKPGHKNQTMGLIQGFSRYRNVNVKWLPPVSLAKNIARFFFKKCGHKTHEFPDLLLGAGHKTHFTLLSLRKCFGGRVVIMMSPSLPLSCFDVCLIPRHDNPPKKNFVIETLGPINRILYAKTPSNSRRKKTGLILVGGPSRHFTWNTTVIVKQIVELSTNDSEIDWTLAGSRRTPADFYRSLRTHLPKMKQVLPDDVSSEWLPEQFSKTGKIWVTEDSMSMVYEALTSGAETGVVRLPYKKSSRIRDEIERLINEGRVRLISSDTVARTENPNINEAERCAKLVLHKFGL